MHRAARSLSRSSSPYLPFRDSVYGLILDVDSGELIPVDV
jgi:hypothetical protein